MLTALAPAKAESHRKPFWPSGALSLSQGQPQKQAIPGKKKHLREALLALVKFTELDPPLPCLTMAFIDTLEEVPLVKGGLCQPGGGAG